NKLLAKKAAKICVAYEGMERFFPKEKIIFTGNPVRKDLLNAVNERVEGIAFYGLDANKKTVLVTGGSLGAGSINKAMVRWLEKIAGWKDVQVIWQCGSYYHKELGEQLKERMPENVKFMPFLKRMDLAYACADLVVARAGRYDFELCLLGKAVVLVPSPNVAEDHQTKNAMALVNKQAAVMVKDAEVVERLGEVMERLLQDDGERKSLSEAYLDAGNEDSDEGLRGKYSNN
ncbi:MAG: UDP-N-acetylglucosamine--N-acetylmuramyl-(pentapeptide) pyrophosphoryl-undecaprenol N-acetylglucosamine transferase, partial [Butyricimonas faecihominis]